MAATCLQSGETSNDCPSVPRIFFSYRGADALSMPFGGERRYEITFRGLT